MKIDIYVSANNGEKFISVPSDTDVDKMSFPDDLDEDYKDLKPFRKDLDIDPSKNMVALDPVDVIGQINNKGYATHRASVTTYINP